MCSDDVVGYAWFIADAIDPALPDGKKLRRKSMMG